MCPSRSLQKIINGFNFKSKVKPENFLNVGFVERKKSLFRFEQNYLQNLKKYVNGGTTVSFWYDLGHTSKESTPRHDILSTILMPLLFKYMTANYNESNGGRELDFHKRTDFLSVLLSSLEENCV